ncbi:MAG TPA: hypothetical protein VMH24_00965 [Candidatus Sulfotelmatobacter sp.]|nr:hypothetical protein [Candidatus Sulfotelmatobacter sp.]
MDTSAPVPLAGSCTTCGAPLQAGRAACQECGAPVGATGVAPGGGDPPGWSTVPPESRPQPPSGLRPPGPNEWYSDRFRTAAAGGPDAAPAPGPPQPAVAGLFSDLPFQAPPLAVGWVVVAGTWVSALAFLLPWASAPGLGYLQSWGLYKPSHVLVFFLVVAVGLVTILPLRIPPLIRFALGPVILGAFELGLFWEWLGSQSLGPGIWALVAGGILCLGGGIVVASRLVEPPRPT